MKEDNMYDLRGCWTFSYSRQTPKTMEGSSTSNEHNKP